MYKRQLHYKMSNFKYGTIGSPLMIVRLVFTLLPLVAFVVPVSYTHLDVYKRQPSRLLISENSGFATTMPIALEVSIEEPPPIAIR